MPQLKSLRQIQTELTDVIRSGKGKVKGVEPRRVTIYQELFFNNIEGFCSTAFPVVKSILGEKQWLALVRRFFKEAECETPHFIEISQEFLAFLLNVQHDFPQFPFLAELTHYEWVELDLGVKFEQEHIKLKECNAESMLALTNLCSPLMYNYPVHTISAKNVKDIKPELTALVVYRDKAYDVKFILVDQLTVIMLQILQQNKGITKAQLALELARLNESFTKSKMLDFLDNALPKFIQLNLITAMPKVAQN
jgi:hypothetical protein